MWVAMQCRARACLCVSCLRPSVAATQQAQKRTEPYGDSRSCAPVLQIAISWARVQSFDFEKVDTNFPAQAQQAQDTTACLEQHSALVK